MRFFVFGRDPDSRLFGAENIVGRNNVDPQRVSRFPVFRETGKQKLITETPGYRDLDGRTGTYPRAYYLPSCFRTQRSGEPGWTPMLWWTKSSAI